MVTSHIIKQAANHHHQHASHRLWWVKQETDFFFPTNSCNWSSFHPQLKEQVTKPQTNKKPVVVALFQLRHQLDSTSCSWGKIKINQTKAPSAKYFQSHHNIKGKLNVNEVSGFFCTLFGVHYADSEKYEGGSGKFWCCVFLLYHLVTKPQTTRCDCVCASEREEGEGYFFLLLLLSDT